jgi:uncharacterized membrane protein YeaQ/YmgE (transglycosylase-associated protein family)
MQLLLWATYGLVAGWLAGKMITLSQGRDQFVDLVLGTAGGIGGGFLFDMTPFQFEGKMIYTSLAAVLGGVILTIGSRYLTVARYRLDSTNQPSRSIPSVALAPARSRSERRNG